MPLTGILAAAPLDRLLGFGGLLAFIGLAFGLATANGAFANLGPASLNVPWWWIGLGLCLLVLAGRHC